MAALIVMALVFALIGLLILGSSSQAQQVAAQIANGIPGRGLILQASSVIYGTSIVAGQRCEMRAIVLDVEIPGQAPYEVSFTPAIPKVVEALPGAAVDVRVDPKNPNNVTIVGPAGSSAWLATAMPLIAQGGGFTPPGTGSGKGAGVFFFVLAVACAGVAVLVGIGNAASTPRGGYCAAAVRCCKAANLSKCTKYEHESTKTCESLWKSFEKQASKLHNKCE